jgi:hypothetical protein
MYLATRCRRRSTLEHVDAQSRYLDTVVRQMERALEHVGATHHSNTLMASRGGQHNTYGLIAKHIRHQQQIHGRGVTAHT